MTLIMNLRMEKKLTLFMRWKTLYTSIITYLGSVRKILQANHFFFFFRILSNIKGLTVNEIMQKYGMTKKVAQTLKEELKKECGEEK